MKNNVFQILGFSDEVTTCDLCGKAELKGTYVLQEYDATGGPIGPVVHFGSTCGRRAAGWTVAQWSSRAKSAVAAQRVAELEPIAQKIKAAAEKEMARLPEPEDLGLVAVWSTDRVWGYSSFDKHGPKVHVASWQQYRPHVEGERLKAFAFDYFVKDGIKAAGFVPYEKDGTAIYHLVYGDRKQAERELT